MGERTVPVEASVEAALDMSSRPLRVETFAELFDSVAMAEIIGPDTDGVIWLSGVHAATGMPRTVRLGRPDEPLGRAALRWRAARAGRDRRH